jgi:hypothetical protein
MQAYGSARQTRSVADRLNHAAAGLAGTAAEQLLTVTADHFLGCHAEQPLRRLVNASDVQVSVVQKQSVRKLIEDRL